MTTEYSPSTDHYDAPASNGRRGRRTEAASIYPRASLLRNPRTRALVAAAVDAQREIHEAKAEETTAEAASQGVIADMLGDVVAELRGEPAR